MPVRLSFESLGRDGAAGIVDRALGEVVANIEDRNTPFGAKRKVVFEVEFKPGEDRETVDVSYKCKAVLAPVRPVAIKGAVVSDRATGEVGVNIPEVGKYPDQNELPIENPKVTKIKEAQNG